MLYIIDEGFDDTWLWEKYNKKIMNTLAEQIESRFPNQENLLVNTTWFGPTFDNNRYELALTYANKLDNIFLLATVDPLYISPPDLEIFIKKMGNANFFRIGNFDNSDYSFNFFAPVLADNFVEYSESELLLTDIKYKYITYNRKPRFHRVQLVKKLLDCNLDSFGIITLGKPDVIYDQDPNNDLFFSAGEKIEDYVKYGHWYDLNEDDPTGIPHDVLSLHNMEYWKHHFLHIVGATMFWPWDDIFVSETMYKPILGLRPFVINGNTRTYQWLRDRGFKTFNQYFPADLDNTHENSVHQNIIHTVDWICKQDNQNLLDMYNDMLPDLRYNKQRFYEFAKEQEGLIQNMF